MRLRSSALSLPSSARPGKTGPCFTPSLIAAEARRTIVMKARVCFSIWISLLAVSANAPAQNRVLELDGNRSYVELPPNILSGLEEVTVEGWVNWSQFRGWDRFFSFGEGENRVLVASGNGTNELHLVIDQRVTGGWIGNNVPVLQILDAD